MYQMPKVVWISMIQSPLCLPKRKPAALCSRPRLT
jgi:hypothetical protein